MAWTRLLTMIDANAIQLERDLMEVYPRLSEEHWKAEIAACHQDHLP